MCGRVYYNTLFYSDTLRGVECQQTKQPKTPSTKKATNKNHLKEKDTAKTTTIESASHSLCYLITSRVQKAYPTHFFV